MPAVMKSYKFRMVPKGQSTAKVDATFDACRFVSNMHVEAFYSWNSEGPNPRITSKFLKDLEEYSFLNNASAAALQQKDIDFDEFKKQYFSKKRKKKLGKPKFKSKKGRQSFRLPNQKFNLDQDKQQIRLEKIGFVDVIIDRKIPEAAKYKSVTVSKDTSGKYFVSILVEENIDVMEPTGKSVGIDLGLTDFIIMSNGLKVENPRYYRKSQAKLAKAQKHLSRKKKVSNGYEKQRRKVNKIHEKVRNQREYLQHCISMWLVESNDIIVTENLNVEGIKKRYGKSVSDVAWASFLQKIEYKSKWYGRTFHKVDRLFPSTKTCSCCGVKNNNLTLSDRNWLCESCGAFHNRDHNAAKNIIQRGLLDLYNFTSDELADYRRRELLRPDEVNYPKADSMKRLIKTV